MKFLFQLLFVLVSMGTLMVEAQVPTTRPTKRPRTSKPTSRPSSKPTCAPVTPKPTSAPTAKPTRKPTWTKTSKPTKRRKKMKKVKNSPKCPKKSKKSSKRPSIKKTKSPAYSAISFQAASVVNTVSCIDGDLTYADNWGVKRNCTWLDAPWKLTNNCGTATSAVTSLGTNCKFACRYYNACSCTDAAGTFMTHVKSLQNCTWLDGSYWKMINNCGSDTAPPTQIGMNCRAACKDYNDCGLEYYYWYYTSRRE